MASEEFGIIVEVKPHTREGMAQVNADLAGSERRAREASKEIERSWANVAKEAARASKEAARAQEESARHVTMTVEREARARAKAEEDAHRRAADSAKEQSQRLTAAYRQIVGPAAEFNRKLQEANQLLRQGDISASQYAAHIHRLQGEMRDFSAPSSPGPAAGGGAGGLAGMVSSYAAPAAAVAVVASLGKEALALGDSYQNLTNRLTTLTGSEAAAVPLREKLLDLAIETRTENGALVDLYARIAGAVKELGVSESDTIQFTKRLTESFKVSGASTMAQQQAMVQLAQGLGAGALRGEEFNSVLEAAPNIIDIVGQHIGKTRGEMRAMAEQGALTTKTIIDAFAEAGDEIDAKFAKNVATTSDLMVVLHNEIERTVGAFVQQTGVLPMLADGFKAVGQEIRDVGAGLHVAGNLMKEWDKAVPDWMKAAAIGPLGSSKGRQIAGLIAGPQVARIKDIATDDLGAQLKQWTDTQEAARRAADAFEIAEEQKRKFFETDSGAQQQFREVLDTTAVRFRDAFTKDIPAAAPHVAKVKADLTDAQKALVDLGAIAIDVFDEFVYQADRGVEAMQEISDEAAAADAAFESLRGTFDFAVDALGDGVDMVASFADGSEEAAEKTKKIKDEIDTLGEVLAAQGGNVLVSGIDAFVDSINGAEVSFREFAQSVLADLEKMLIKFLAFQAIKATIGVADGGIGSILSKALGFAAGGTFTVPNGGGGTDSVPVFFRATPGERVTVSTPGQQQMQGGGAQPVVNFKSVNVVDMGAAAREYANSAENEQVVLNIIMRNESKLRGLLT